MTSSRGLTVLPTYNEAENIVALARAILDQVATLEIPALPANADVKMMMTFAEHLSYTPWHHLPAHEPVGSINLARRAAYDAISTVRHHLNHKLRREPRGGESQENYLRAIEEPGPHGRETRPPVPD